jgi:endonuclease-8
MWNKTDWLELRGATDISIYDGGRWEKLLARLGPDPLESSANPEKAFEVIRGRKTAIGALLMDQAVIAGIGNIYRAELLYRARIHPFRRGDAVSDKELKALWRDAVTLMRDGMVDRRIVTTRRKDRPHKQGNALRDETHYVYRRARKPCWVCGTAIASETMAGRTLYWCPVCQKN